MKVALYTGELPPPVFIDRLIHGLAREGMDLVLFGALHGKVRYAYPNVEVVGYRGKWHKMVQLLKYTVLLVLFQPKAKKKLDALLAQNGRTSALHRLKYYPVLYHQPTVFHLQWAKAIDEWLWVQEFGMQLVVSARGTHVTISPKVHPNYAESYTRNFPEVSAFHTVSKALAKEVARYGVAPAVIHTVYSGLNLSDFPFQNKTKTTEVLRILSIGRPHWVKGYSYAIDAMQLLKEDGFAFSYTIIVMEASEELIFLRSQSGLESSVHFQPSKSSAPVLEAIQQADVLLLPSVEEGIANVVLEAMALGTLVVSTDCGGMTEVITDRHNGFLVPVRNPESMAAALQRVANLSNSDYQRLTLAARQTIEERFTEARMVTSMQQLYQTITPTVCE